MFNETFIFVAGATPQIITETIYALAQKEPPVYPNEIYVITTDIGRKKIQETLIEGGVLEALREEYKMPPFVLTEESFILACDSDGKVINDIRNESENESIGDLITTFIKQKARDMNRRLHCSLAGGRKTMSFYLGSALQLFGRPWDKLYHVLVTPEFESNPEFFYKPKKNRTIECRLPDGSIKRFNTKDAEIHLAELPFIRLSSKVSFQRSTFKELVEEGQQEIDTATMQPPLKANLYERTIYIGDTFVEMVPMQFMIYTALLRQKTDHCRYRLRPCCLDCTDCFSLMSELASRPALEEMAKDYKRLYKDQPLKAGELLNKWPDGIAIEQLRHNISKINRVFEEAIEDSTLQPYYKVTTVKKYGGSRYGVRVEKAKIKIVP